MGWRSRDAERLQQLRAVAAQTGIQSTRLVKDDILKKLALDFEGINQATVIQHLSIHGLGGVKE
jgi:hypothetical protein